MERYVPMLSDPRHFKMFEDFGNISDDVKKISDVKSEKILNDFFDSKIFDSALILKALEAVLNKHPEMLYSKMLPVIIATEDIEGAIIPSARMLAEREEYGAMSSLIDSLDEYDSPSLSLLRGVVARINEENAVPLFLKAWFANPNDSFIYDNLEAIDSEGGWDVVRSIQSMFAGNGLLKINGNGKYSDLYECCQMWEDGLKDDAMCAVQATDSFKVNAYYKIVYARMCTFKGLYAPASNVYYEALALQPELTFAAVELAKLLILSGDFHESIEICKKRLSIDSTNKEVWKTLISASLNSGEEYEGIIDKFISIKPEDATSFNYCAEELVERGHISDAYNLVKKMAHRCADKGYGYVCVAYIDNIRRDYQSALENANKALKYRPDDVAALCVKAKAYLNLGKLKKARDVADQALEADVDDDRSLIVIKDILIADKEYERALKFYDDLIINHPNSAELRRGRAELLFDMGKKQESLDGYRDALNVKEDSKLFISIIISLLKNNDIENLRSFVDDYDDIYGKEPKVWMARGNGEYLDRKYADASNSYAKAAALAPDDSIIWHSKGLAEQKAGDLISAEASFDRAIILNLENPEYWVSKALVQEENGDLVGAVKSINRAISLSPEDYVVLVLKAKLLIKAKMYNEALYFLDIVEAMSPLSIQILEIRKNVYKELGQHDKVVETCRKILNISRSNTQASIDLAFAYAEMGIVANGMKLMNDLFVKDKNSHMVLKGKAEFDLKYGEKKDAIGVYDMIVSKFPDDIVSAKILSDLYREEGETEKADSLATTEIIQEIDTKPISQFSIDDILSSGDDDAILEALKNAVDSGVDDPEPYILLSERMLASGDIDEALRSAAVGRRLFSSDARLLFLIGRAQSELGDHVSALVSYNEAIDYGMSSPELYIEKGKTESILGLYNPAIDSFMAVLRKRPDSIEASMGLCELYAKSGDNEKAAPILDSIIAKDSGNTKALMMRADIYARKNDAEGLLYLYPAIKSYVTDLEDLWFFADALRAAGEVAKADALFDNDDQSIKIIEDEDIRVWSDDEINAAEMILISACASGTKIDNPSVPIKLGLEKDIGEAAVAYLKNVDKHHYINTGDDFFEDMEQESYDIIVGGCLTDVENTGVSVEDVFMNIEKRTLDNVKRMQSYIMYSLFNDEEPVAFSKRIEPIARDLIGKEKTVYEVMKKYNVGVHTAVTAIKLSQ